MPELGKATYIVEIETRKFEKGLDKVEKKTVKSTDSMNDAVAGMADTWGEATTGVKKNTTEVDKNTKSVDKNRRSLIGLGKAVVFLNQGLSLAGKLIKLMKIPALIAAAGAAAQAITVLSGGLVALTGALTPTIGAAASAANAYLALGQAVAVIKIAQFDKLAAALQGDAEAFKSLTPAAKELGATLMGLKKPFDSLRAAVQSRLFSGLNIGLKSAAQNFGIFKSAMVGMAGVLGRLGERFGKLLGSKGFGSLFAKVTAENEKIVSRLGRALIHIVDALFQVMAAARPLTNWLTKMALQWAKNTDAAAKTGRKTGDLAKFFEHTRRSLHKVWMVLVNFSKALINLGGLGRKTGMDLFKHMNLAAKSFLKFTESTKGRNSIKDFFKDIKAPLLATGRLFNELVKAILKIGQTPGFTKLVNMLRKELLPVLIKIVNGTLKHLGPNLVKIIGNLSQAFGGFIGQAGPLNMFVTALAWMSGVLKKMSELSPAIKSLMITLVSAAGVVSALGFARATSELFGFKKGLEVVKGAYMLLTTEMIRARIFLLKFAIQQKLTAAANATAALAMRGFGMAVAWAGGAVRLAMMATGIGALIVVAGLIITNWDKVKAFLGKAWEWMKGAAKTVAHAVGAAFKWLADAVMWAIRHGLLGPIPLIISRWGEVKTFIGKIWNAIKAGAATLWSWMKSAAKTVFDILTWPYRQAWKVIKAVWKWIFGAVSDAVKFISDRWDSIAHVLTTPFRVVKDVVSSVFSWISDKVDWLMGKLDGLKTAAEAAIPGGEHGIGSDQGLLGIGGVPGLAGGGYITASGKVMYFAGGGFVPKGTDTVPAMLSPGEAVVSAQAVSAAGGPAAFKNLATAGGGLPTQQNPFGPTDKQMADAEKRYGTLTRIANSFEKERLAMIKKNGKQRERAEHQSNAKSAAAFVSAQRKIAKSTEKQAKKTKKDAEKGAKATKKSAVESEDSWESLGGGINEFQKDAGRDLTKHRKDIDKTSKAEKKRARDAVTCSVQIAKAKVKEVTDLLKGDDKANKSGKNRQRQNRQTTRSIILDIGDNQKSLQQLAKEHERTAKKSIDKSKDMKNGVGKNIMGLSDTVHKGIGIVVNTTNKALKAFGVEPLNFGVEKPKKKQKGGVIVPGQGSGDKVPALLEPGEIVWNREAVAGMGGPTAANAPNKHFPRFQKGGIVPGYASGGIIEQALGPYDIPPIQYASDHAGSNSHLHLDFFTARQAQLFGHKMQGLGWAIDEYTPTHGNPYNFGGISASHQSPGHYDGTAFDANTSEDETKSQVAQIAKMLGGGLSGLTAQKIAKLVMTGPDGPLKSMGQSALDKAVAAANKYIASKAPTEGYTDVKAGGPVVAQMGKILLGNGFSRAGAAGIIGNAYRESLWNPGAVGTGGGGLFGFTTGDVSLAALQSFANKKGTSWQNVATQMEFMLNNPNSGGLVSDDYYNGLEGFLKSTNNVHDATYRFMNEWERPGIPAFEDRLAGAQQAFNMNTWQRGGKVGKYAKGGLVSGLLHSTTKYSHVSDNWKRGLSKAQIKKAEKDPKYKAKLKKKAQKHADKKRGKILTGALDAISAIGLNPKIIANMEKVRKEMNQYDDYADRASTIGEGSVVYGKTEAEWLNKQLKRMWKLRNMMVKALKAVERKKKKLKQTYRKLNAELHSTDDDVKKTEKQLQNAKDAKKPDKKRIERLTKKLATKKIRSSVIGQQLLPAIEKQQGLIGRNGKRFTSGLNTIQGQHSPMRFFKKLRSPVDSRFGGDLLNLQVEIRDLAGDSGADDPSNDILAGLLADSQSRYNVLSAQSPVFNDFFAGGFKYGPDFGGIFHKGLDAGPIPGRRGEEKVILAQAGELVAHPEQLAELSTSSGGGAPPTPVVIVQDGAVNADRIRVIYREESARQVSKSRRRISS